MWLTTLWGDLVSVLSSSSIITYSTNALVFKNYATILEWTIKLESEGIKGEDMQFDTTEKETAKTIPQTINNYYGNTSVIRVY